MLSDQRAAPTAAGRPARAYLPQLDGLRALAVAFVFVHHFVPGAKWFGGSIGVDIFFVLSGFLITGILLGEIAKHGGIRFRRFTGRRLVRLYPPLIAAVVVVGVAAIFLAPDFRQFLVSSAFALTYTTPFAVEFTSTLTQYWRHTWTLGIEELFYLVWPLVLLLAFRSGARPRTVATWAAAAGALLLGSGIALEAVQLHAPYLLRSGGLLLGCCLAIALRDRTARVPIWWGWAGAALLAGALAVASYAEFVGVTLAVAGTIALLPVLVHRGDAALTRGLTQPVLVYLGRISYELYLWHYAIITLVFAATEIPVVETAWLTLPASVALAAASHALLAPRIDRWKARLPY